MLRFVNRLVLFGVIAVTAHAGVLVDNGFLDPTAETPISNFSHADGNQYQSADRFILITNVAIRRIDFWGLYSSTNALCRVPRDDFTVRIFADTNGAPDIEPMTQFHMGRLIRRHVLRHVHANFGPFDYYAYSATLHPAIPLPAGQYWLSIVNDIPVAETGVMWAIAPITPSHGSLHFRMNDGEPWFKSVEGYGIAFKLRGVKRRGAD